MRTTMSIVSVIVSFQLVVAAQAGDSVLQGNVFLKGNGDTALYTVELALKGDPSSRICYERVTDRNGRVIVATEATYAEGRLSVIHCQQQQTGETAKIEFRDGKVLYSYKQDGKPKQSSEKDSNDLVPLPAIPYIIMSKWDDLHGGKTVDFKIPVPERQQAIAVRVSKERTWSQMGRSFTELKLEPSNLFFRSLVDPVYYVFEDQSRTLVEYRGRLEIKSGTPGNWEDGSGRIAYRPAAGLGR